MLLVGPREKPFSSSFAVFASALVLVCAAIFMQSCQEQQPPANGAPPSIEFTSVPRVGRLDNLGDAGRTSTLAGRVVGARPGQQVVLYAHALSDDGKVIWFVQPYVLEPFTKIESNSKWRNLTHPGSEYAALLVEPGFAPPGKTPQLPTQGVVAVAITQGWPPLWRSWWFPWLCLIGATLVAIGLYSIWHYRLTNKLNMRFEERLAERTRIAQELHDTLLQGVISASMQLHVVADQIPADSPAKPGLNRVLDLMARVVEEGRTAVGGLRSPQVGSTDLSQAFQQVHQEYVCSEELSFRVIEEGSARPLNPIVRDEIYSIGREALANAFRHSKADKIEVELEYAASGLRVLIRDSGVGFDPRMLPFGRDGHWGLSGMRERAKHINARLRVLSRPAAGTEVELTVPSHVAFVSKPPGGVSKWIGKFLPKGKQIFKES